MLPSSAYGRQGQGEILEILAVLLGAARLARARLGLRTCWPPALSSVRGWPSSRRRPSASARIIGPDCPDGCERAPHGLHVGTGTAARTAHRSGRRHRPAYRARAGSPGLRSGRALASGSLEGTSRANVQSSRCPTIPPPVHRRTQGRAGKRSRTDARGNEYPKDTVGSAHR